MDNEKSLRNSTCEDQINVAERELSAFIRAVTELFGPQQARLSAQDWLDQMELLHTLPHATSRDWRKVTVAASARLAKRVISVPDQRTSLKSTDTKVSPIPSSNCFASALVV